MPDNTSTPTVATDPTLLTDDATGIYAPVRFTHTTPKQRYGWRAALVILVHALLLALVLSRLDLLASAPAASPEALDIIVVDLSGKSELAEAATPDSEPPAEEQPVTPLEIVLAEPVPEPPKTISSPPAPAPRTAPSQTSKTSAAATVSTSSSSRQETVGGSSNESEIVKTYLLIPLINIHDRSVLKIKVDILVWSGIFIGSSLRIGPTQVSICN